MNNDLSTNYPEERRKIINGVYSLIIAQGKQNKHIPGTKEFLDKERQMQQEIPNGKPSILEVDAGELVKKHKGTGKIRIMPNAQYPREIINADVNIGKTWVQSLQKYVNTKRFEIHYSSKGAHVVPVNDYVKE